MQTNGFRFSFTPLLGVLPTFPSRYWSTIGLPVIFSLAGWSPRFRTGFLVSRPTQVGLASHPRYPYGPFTLCGPTFQTVPVPGCSAYEASYYPARASTPTVWAPPLSSPFARHYSGNRSFFLLLQVLRCFSSLRQPRHHGRCAAFGRAGSPNRAPTDHFPFADPRGFSQLTASFFASGSPGIPRSPLSSFSRSRVILLNHSRLSS